MSDWKVYWYYAEIVLSFGQRDDQNNQIEPTKETADKYFTLIQKAFRNLYNQPSWELTVESCKEMVTNSAQILSSNCSFLLIF